MPSLRQNLNDIIRVRGSITLDEVHYIAEQQGHKQSYVERELRQSKSPNVEAIKNEKGFITGYKWIGVKVMNKDAYDPEWIKKLEKQKKELAGGGLI